MIKVEGSDEAGWIDQQAATGYLSIRSNSVVVSYTGYKYSWAIIGFTSYNFHFMIVQIPSFQWIFNG